MAVAVKNRTDIESFIEANRKIIASYGVERLGLFGSYKRGDQKKESDIDFLVEFKAGQKTYKNFINLVYFLEDQLGHEIELVTLESLSPYLKDTILETVEDVFRA
jgi:predicted nucleotidyltransferase